MFQVGDYVSLEGVADPVVIVAGSASGFASREDLALAEPGRVLSVQPVGADPETGLDAQALTVRCGRVGAEPVTVRIYDFEARPFLICRAQFLLFSRKRVG